MIKFRKPIATIILYAVLLPVFVTACGLSPDETATPSTAVPTAMEVPTQTPQPTATSTLEPTEPPTVTPTPEPVPGIPLVWMLPLIEAIQEVEPDATYTTGPCSDPEYAEFEECVTAVDFCPENYECSETLLFSPIWERIKSDPATLEFLYKVPERVVGEKYFVQVYRGRLISSKLFLSEKEIIIFACQMDLELSGDINWPVAAFKIAFETAEALVHLDFLEISAEYINDDPVVCG